MAYGLLLYKEITAPEGKHRLEIYKDGYSGSSAEINSLVRDSIVLSKNAGEVSDAITTSVLTFSLYDTGQMDYTQFFTPSATLYKVVLKIISGATTTTRWTGFLTPDSYAENLASHDTITLTARDNLGRLNDYDFSLGRGQMLSVRSIINSGLSVAGVAMGVTFTTAKVATSPATILAVDGLVNTSLLQGMTWHAALTLLLEGLGMTLSWNEGNAFEVRDITQAPSATQAAFFINKSGYRMIRPAWKNLTVEQDYGLRDNFYEGQFSSEDCGSGVTFTPTSGTHGWNVSTPFLMMNPYKGAPTPSETLYIPIQGGDAIDTHIDYTFKVPVLKRPLKISLKCNNTAWIWQDPADAFGYIGISSRSILSYTQQGQYYRSGRYFLRFRFNIFMTVGGTEYVLRNTWQEYDATTIEEPYLYFVMPAVVDEYGHIVSEDTDNEVSFYVGEVPGAGTMRFVIYKTVAQSKEDGEPEDRAMALLTANSYTLPFAKITDIGMYIDEGVSGRSKLVTVNTSHNVKSSADFSIGQVPNDRGNVLLYLGGLFYTDTYNTPLTSFKRSSSASSTYDLLELVARERISFNNDNYDQLSGTMKAATAFSFAKGISFGSTDYRLVSASLNVLSNTLQVQAMQTEPSFATADYTIEEVDSEGGYSSRGSYSGGSIPQGPQAGGGYFYRLEDSETDIATDYDINIIQTEGSGSGSGSGAVYKNASAILRHLTLKTTTGGLPYIEIDVGLAGLSFGSFGGLNPGSGSGGGGGSSTLVDLTDTAITSPSDGQFLAYDGDSSSATYGKWKNKSLELALADLSDVAGTTPTDGQALVWDGDAATWKPGTVGGGVTVDSKDADIGTSLTTIATVGNTDIKAKITHQAVVLSGGTSNGTLKLTVGGVAGDNIPIPGLGDMAYKPQQYIGRSATQDAAGQQALLGLDGFGNGSAASGSSYVHWDAEHNAWYFNGNIIAEGYGSFGGVNASSATGVSLSQVWQSLTTNNDSFANDKIDSNHLKLGSGLSIDGSGNIIATVSGTVGIAQGGTGLTSIDAFSLLYAPSNAGTTNALAALAPNTDATKKFLSMTGTGTAGAAPAWSSLAFSDIADLASWPGSAGITTLGTIGTGVWQATPIAYTCMAPQYIAGTRTIAATAQDILKGIVGICNPVSPTTSGNDITDASYFYWDSEYGAWHFKGNVIADGFGSFGGANDEDPGSEISVFEGPWSSYTSAYAEYVPTAGIVNSRFASAEADIFTLQNAATSLASRATALEARPTIVFVQPAESYPSDANMAENTLYVKLSQVSS